MVVNPGTLHEERSDAKAPLRLIFLAIRDFAVPGLPAGCLSQEKYRVLSCGEYQYKMDIYLRELLQETSSQIEFYQEISQGLVSALLVLVMRLIRINPEDEAALSQECQKIKEYWIRILRLSSRWIPFRKRFISASITFPICSRSRRGFLPSSI